jgi:hypothetical protein
MFELDLLKLDELYSIEFYYSPLLKDGALLVLNSFNLEYNSALSYEAISKALEAFGFSICFEETDGNFSMN